MKYTAKKLNAYCTEFSSVPPSYLDFIERDSQINVLMGQMVSGKIVGRFLSFISKLKQPKRILEIGTFTAYSTLCLAEGLQPAGHLDSIEINRELENRINRNISLSPYKNNITITYGDAKNILPNLKTTYDLVFLDAYKRSYQTYYELLLPLVNKEGIIIADNVLWSGKVFDQTEKEMDKDTKALHDFNVYVQKDKRVSNLLLPFLDGLMVIEKK